MNSLKEALKELDKLSGDVEFLHGVPVAIPKKFKDELHTLITKVWESAMIAGAEGHRKIVENELGIDLAFEMIKKCPKPVSNLESTPSG